MANQISINIQLVESRLVGMPSMIEVSLREVVEEHGIPNTMQLVLDPLEALKLAHGIQAAVIQAVERGRNPIPGVIMPNMPGGQG